MLRVSWTARSNGPGRPVPSLGPKGSRACPGRSDRRGHQPMSDGQGETLARGAADHIDVADGVCTLPRVGSSAGPGGNTSEPSMTATRASPSSHRNGTIWPVRGRERLPRVESTLEGPDRHQGPHRAGRPAPNLSTEGNGLIAAGSPMSSRIRAWSESSNDDSPRPPVIGIEEKVNKLVRGHNPIEPGQPSAP